MIAKLILSATAHSYAHAVAERIHQFTHKLPQSVVVKGAAEKTLPLGEVVARLRCGAFQLHSLRKTRSLGRMALV